MIIIKTEQIIKVLQGFAHPISFYKAQRYVTYVGIGLVAIKELRAS